MEFFCFSDEKSVPSYLNLAKASCFSCFVSWDVSLFSELNMPAVSGCADCGLRQQRLSIGLKRNGSSVLKMESQRCGTMS